MACVGSMSVIAPVRDYIHSLVHPSARCHAPTAARHYAFMAPRLIGSLSAVAGLPVYLAIRGAPSAIENTIAKARWRSVSRSVRS